MGTDIGGGMMKARLAYLCEGWCPRRHPAFTSLYLYFAHRANFDLLLHWEEPFLPGSGSLCADGLTCLTDVLCTDAFIFQIIA